MNSALLPNGSTGFNPADIGNGQSGGTSAGSIIVGAPPGNFDPAAGTDSGDIALVAAALTGRFFLPLAGKTSTLTVTLGGAAGGANNAAPGNDSALNQAFLSTGQIVTTGSASSIVAGAAAGAAADSGAANLPNGGTSTDGTTTNTVSVPGSGLVFDNTFESDVTAGFENCIISAEDTLASEWTNSITLNMDFDTADYGPLYNAAYNSFPALTVTYAQLTGALAAHASGAYALAAVASLPATDPNPAGGSDWSLPYAYARMLGLSSIVPTVDDTVTLNSGISWSYGQDVINTVEHEITEGAMGRVGALGDLETVFGPSSAWSTMDLFRYSSAGVPDDTDGRDGQTTYFSYDGGIQLSSAAGLSFNNEFNSAGTQVNSGDTADFTEQDVFGENVPGETNILSQTDIEIMDVLGWDEPMTPCYCRGTLILTETGEAPIEDLAIGDKVMTFSGEARPIKWIGKRSYDGRFALGQKQILPVCIKTGALDHDVPRRDLWVSPNHALYLEGVLIEARDLVNGVSIFQAERVKEAIEYFHIELDSHDVILAEGAPAESFIDDDNRGLFHNAHEYPVLYPGAVAGPARYCVPRRDQGYEVERARARIARRAGIAVTAEALPGTLRGHIDEIGRQRICGWAQDTAHPEAPVCLDILASGELIGRVVANRYSADLAAAGLGSGSHSFEFVPPAELAFEPRIKVQRSLDGAGLNHIGGGDGRNPRNLSFLIPRVRD